MGIREKLKTIAKNKRSGFKLPKDFNQACSVFKRSDGLGQVEFKLYSYQKKLAELIDNYNHVLILKSRSVGLASFLFRKYLIESIKQESLVTNIFTSDWRVKKLSQQLREVSTSPYAQTKSELPGRFTSQNNSSIRVEAFSDLMNPGILRAKNIWVDGFLNTPDIPQKLERIYRDKTDLEGRVNTILSDTPGTNIGLGFDLMKSIAGERLEDIAQEVAKGRLVCDEGIEGFFYIPKGDSVLVCLHYRAVPGFFPDPDSYCMSKAEFSNQFDLKFVGV